MKKFREILSSGDKGFTLIELLVVIAVLGILAGIAIPRLGGVTDKAKDAEYLSIGGSLRTAMELYNSQEGNYPDFSSNDAEALKDDTLLGQFLTFDDPENISWGEYTSASSYTIKYTNSDTSTNFVVTQGGVGTE